LYIELSEIIAGKSLKTPVCTISEGEAPQQTINFEDIIATTTSLDLGETFFGDESFDIDELDREGFDGLDDVSLTAEDSDLY
jgi:hypothetical protein